MMGQAGGLFFCKLFTLVVDKHGVTLKLQMIHFEACTCECERIAEAL